MLYFIEAFSESSLLFVHHDAQVFKKDNFFSVMIFALCILFLGIGRHYGFVCVCAPWRWVWPGNLLRRVDVLQWKCPAAGSIVGGQVPVCVSRKGWFQIWKLSRLNKLYHFLSEVCLFILLFTSRTLYITEGYAPYRRVGWWETDLRGYVLACRGHTYMFRYEFVW